MNIFKKKRYAHDSGLMMFFSLLLTLFFLPFSGDAATCTLLLGWIFYLLRSYFIGWKFTKTALDKPLAVFVCMAFLSIINSPEKAFSFYNAYHLVGKYVLIYYLAVLSIKDEKQLKTVFAVSGAAAILVFLCGFFQYIGGIDTTGMNWTDTNTFPEMTMRIFSTWENPNLFAGYLDMSIALAFGIFICSDTNKIKIITGIFLVLAAVSIGLTYARGACLSIVMAIAAYAVCYKKKIILPLILLIALVLYFDTNLFNRMISVFTTIDTSTELRFALWESTSEMILDHPFLGIGWGAYYFVYPSYDFYMQGNFIKIVHAHNMYLNIAAEIGLIGFAAYMICFIGNIGRAFKTYGQLSSNFLRGAALGCALALLSIIFNGFTDFVLFNTRLSMFFWAVMAAVIIMSHWQANSRKDSHTGFFSLPSLSAEAIAKNKAHNLDNIKA